ncbi:hypothetical protein AB0K49_16355 [Streptomyces decoyicus]|uniref:hypothetical protein n=1 Tax=Streptomyces decoyicus TaxID=249567 RepID=UPI00345C9FD3
MEDVPATRTGGPNAAPVRAGARPRVPLTDRDARRKAPAPHTAPAPQAYGCLSLDGTPPAPPGGTGGTPPDGTGSSD